MKRKDFIKNEYNKFFAKVEKLDYTETKQIATFVKWCFDNHFLDGLTMEDLYYFYRDNELFLPMMKNKEIMIGLVYYFKDKRPVCYVGIDPIDCYDCVQDCSITMYFPITSKRLEVQFYNTINVLLDKKSAISKEWFNREKPTWTGTYLTNK